MPSDAERLSQFRWDIYRGNNTEALPEDLDEITEATMHRWLRGNRSVIGLMGELHAALAVTIESNNEATLVPIINTLKIGTGALATVSIKTTALREYLDETLHFEGSSGLRRAVELLAKLIPDDSPIPNLRHLIFTTATEMKPAPSSHALLTAMEGWYHTRPQFVADLAGEAQNLFYSLRDPERGSSNLARFGVMSSVQNKLPVGRLMYGIPTLKDILLGTDDDAFEQVVNFLSSLLVHDD